MSTEATPRVELLDEVFGASLSGKGELHSLDDGPGSTEAAGALKEVLAALRTYQKGQPPIVFSLGSVAGAPLQRLLTALGEGEVSLTVTGNRAYQAKETALAGLWRVEVDGEHYLEVGDVPAIVRAANRTGTHAEVEIGAPPKEAMNVLPVLAELRHRVQAWKPGQANHVISFTLLPMNAADMQHLERQLGHGPVVAESKGYGRCRVELTQRRNVWSVQHFNVGGALVLDTLEVGDVPIALTAAQEDFEDSAQRLQELLGV